MTDKTVLVVNQIPVVDAPNQRLSVAIGNKDIVLDLKYNTSFDYWIMDVWNRKKLLVAGIKLVLGVDLLYRYNLNIGSITLLHITSKHEVKEPNRYNLVNGDIKMFAFWRENVTVD